MVNRVRTNRVGSESVLPEGIELGAFKKEVNIRTFDFTSFCKDITELAYNVLIILNIYYYYYVICNICKMIMKLKFIYFIFLFMLLFDVNVLKQIFCYIICLYFTTRLLT